MAKEDSKPKWRQAYDEMEKKYGHIKLEDPVIIDKSEWGPEHYEAIRKFEANPELIKTETDEDIIKMLFQ